VSASKSENERPTATREDGERVSVNMNSARLRGERAVDGRVAHSNTSTFTTVLRFSGDTAAVRVPRYQTELLWLFHGFDGQ
jgi:hypothetical protein